MITASYVDDVFLPLVGCPSESVAFIDSLTGRPKDCGGEGRCPSGFVCKTAINEGEICCSSSESRALATSAASMSKDKLVIPQHKILRKK